MPPLSTVLSLTMTQIVSNMVSLLQGCGILAIPSPPSQHSALYPLLTDDMFPLDLLQQELVSLLAPDTAAFLTLFGLLVQHCQQEAASTKLVSSKLSAAVSVQTDGQPSGQPPGLIRPLPC